MASMVFRTSSTIPIRLLSKASSLPGGLTLTGDPDSTKDGQTTVILNDSNKPYLLADFGYQGNVSIGDFVWNDVNGNGIQDSGETGISGATVESDMGRSGRKPCYHGG